MPEVCKIRLSKSESPIFFLAMDRALIIRTELNSINDVDDLERKDSVFRQHASSNRDDDDHEWL